jgi:putative ABC transport system permease protein
VLIARLALASLANRRAAALLTVLAIALSVALLLGVEKVRRGARDSFAATISGTDLIVGARTGDVQLLLYSVFRIGNATANVTWRSYEEVAARPEVAWVVPLSLGDSHRGFRVLGITPAYFERYRYRRDRPLAFAAGGPFGGLFDAVLGADVAEALGYRLGDPLVVAHGLGGPRSPSTTTSRSASPASSPRPARPSTARSTSAWRRSRPSTSTGSPAPRRPGPASPPRRRARWRSGPRR